jgi:hypothetical protein
MRHAESHYPRYYGAKRGTGVGEIYYRCVDTHHDCCIFTYYRAGFIHMKISGVPQFFNSEAGVGTLAGILAGMLTYAVTARVGLYHTWDMIHPEMIRGSALALMVGFGLFLLFDYPFMDDDIVSDTEDELDEDY